MLEVKGLSVHYGKHLALQDVSLSIRLGEAVVVLGANGAGKSSLLNAIGGYVRPDKFASISFSGALISELPSHRLVEHGLALVPEGRGVFGDLTVQENLMLGAYVSRARPSAADQLKYVFELFPRLAERRRQITRTMSGGEQQMVAVGRALMSKPQLLMLDEPSLGLAPVMVRELFTTLNAIRRSGVSLLIVEQNVESALSIADRGYVLEAGRVAESGTADFLSKEASVQAAFLGAART